MEKKCQRKYELIGAGAATIALAPAAVGIGNVLSSLIQKKREIHHYYFRLWLRGFALTEAIALFARIFDLIRILIVS